jgi:hypothetical protein
MRATKLKKSLTGLLVLSMAASVAACGDNGKSGSGDSAAAASSSLPTGSEQVNLDPAEFTTEIDNPYWPMTPGSTWTYRETGPDGVLDVKVTVTDQTKQMANGVEARMVHDAVTKGGRPFELTDDFYAQDSDGNVWYLGENTAEYRNGKVSSREGSFEAGVDGAEAGVAVPANPEPGLEYRQEFLKGEAEDSGRVLGLATHVAVAFGEFDSVLQTEDLNPLDDPIQVENKFYAKGVGPLLTLSLTEESREELLSYRPGA